MQNEKDFNGYTAAMRAAIVEQCKPVDREEFYRELLREAYGTVEVCGFTFDAFRILEKLDPVAFYCGRNDYFGNGDWVEVEGETYNKTEADEAAESVEDGEDADNSND